MTINTTTTAAIIVFSFLPAIVQAGIYSSLRKGNPEPSVAEVPVPASALKGRFCWIGTPDAQALSLGMPSSFCIEDAHAIKSGGNNFSTEITGTPLSGAYPAAKAAGTAWKTKLFSAGEYNGSCAGSKTSVIEMAFETDSLGYLTGLPSIHSYSEATPDTCHIPPKVSRITFTRIGLATASYSWKRSINSAADELGMPAAVEISGLHFENDMLIIESGKPAAGKREVLFTNASNGLKKAEVILFYNSTGHACTEGSVAEISMSFLTDSDGSVLTEPVLSARTGYTPDICHSEAEFKEVLFIRE